MPAEQQDQQIDPIAEYAFDKTLKFTIKAFYEVAATFADAETEVATEVNQAAVEIIKLTRDALAADAFQDRRSFAAAVLDIAALAVTIDEALSFSLESDDPVVSEESYADYRSKLSGLVGLLPTDSEGAPVTDLPEGYEQETDLTRLAVEVDQVAEAAGWLERSGEPATMTLPWGEEVRARIIDLSVDR